jgi:hypothetical protein
MGYLGYLKTRRLLVNAGFRIREANYHYWAFGNWDIEVEREGLPLQRVLWDGRDQWLYVQFFGSREQWWDKEVMKEYRHQSAEDVLAQITSAPSSDLQARREQEQDEYWAEQVRSGSVITGSDA